MLFAHIFFFSLHKLLFHFKKMAYFIGSTLLCVNYLTTPKYACFFRLLFKWATLFYFQFKHFLKQTYLCQLFCDHLKRYFALHWHLICHSVFFPCHLLYFQVHNGLLYPSLMSMTFHSHCRYPWICFDLSGLPMLKQSFLSASLLQCLN